MATFELFTDPLVTCPYNAAHRLKKSRMQIHISKCKKSYLDLDLKSCPFNAKHRILPTEFQYHINNCPDSRLVERQVVYESEERVVFQNDSVYSDAEDDEECWELNADPTAGYDPRRKLDVASGIFRHYTGIQKSPAERKDYYKSLFTNIGDNERATGANLSSASEKSKLKPLRKPKTAAEVLPVQCANETASNLVRRRGGAIGGAMRRQKIAANIFGPPEMAPGLLEGLPSAVGVGRGLGRGLLYGIGRGQLPNQK